MDYDNLVKCMGGGGACPPCKIQWEILFTYLNSGKGDYVRDSLSGTNYICISDVGQAMRAGTAVDVAYVDTVLCKEWNFETIQDTKLKSFKSKTKRILNICLFEATNKWCMLHTHKHSRQRSASRHLVLVFNLGSGAWAAWDNKHMI